MAETVSALVYVFLILWIIPFYPRYRNCIHCRLTHVMMCMICACGLSGAVRLLSYGQYDSVILILPLMIVCSYVDRRDQEIPDLPVMILLSYGITCGNRYSLRMAVLLALVCLPFVFQGKLGMGDVKLMGAMMSAGAMTASCGFIAASLLCLLQHIRKKESSEMKIPFAPYLCAGFTLALVLFPL